MKNNRQEKILAIIEAEPIETQEQLLSKLQEQGMLRTADGPGTVEFQNSLDEPEILALSRALFQYHDA